MVTIEEAYAEIKKCSDLPITYISETEEQFFSTANDYLIIQKDTGEVTHLDHYGMFLWEQHGSTYVVLDNMFSDYLDHYEENLSEETLANLYARAWDRLYYHQKENTDRYKGETDRMTLISRWNIIEQKLYADIRDIVNKDDISQYPPSVKNKIDDPFYRIKPFMYRNGWTDNDNDRTWVVRNDDIKPLFVNS